MPLAVDISLIGDKALERNMETLEPRIQKKVVRQALRVVAKDVQRDAKSLAPRKTGKLRRNIKVRSMKRSRVGIGVLVRTGTRSEMGIPPGSKWYYPAIVEYGHDRAPPKPYMRPALDMNQGPGIRKLGILMGEGIEREAAKAAAKAAQRGN